MHDSATYAAGCIQPGPKNEPEEIVRLFVDGIWYFHRSGQGH